eukprot:1154183-Pelagomonas_calceolata.AAC.3
MASQQANETHHFISELMDVFAWLVCAGAKPGSFVPKFYESQQHFLARPGYRPQCFRSAALVGR